MLSRTLVQRALGHLRAAPRAALTTSAAPPTIQHVQDLFAESQLLLADAQESKGSTYFVEDYKDAQEGVAEALSAYETHLASLEPSERENCRDANDPKFAQLKEQATVLEEELINDE